MRCHALQWYQPEETCHYTWTEITKSTSRKRAAEYAQSDWSSETWERGEQAEETPIAGELEVDSTLDWVDWCQEDWQCPRQTRTAEGAVQVAKAGEERRLGWPPTRG